MVRSAGASCFSTSLVCALAVAAQSAGEVPLLAAPNTSGQDGVKAAPVELADDSATALLRAGVTGQGVQCHGIWHPRWNDAAAFKRLKERLEEPLMNIVARQECPYGQALPGDITWPMPPPDAGGLVASLTTLQLIAVVYSYIPYAIGAASVTAFLTQRGTRQLSLLAWLLLMLAVNELVFKKLCREPRPGTMLQVKDYTGRYAGSCLRTCGMPSSHSILSVGWFTLLFLDAVYRVYPYALNGKTQTIALPPQASSFEKTRRCLLMYVWVPWLNHELLTHTQFVVYISAWFVVLVPVPFMRVVLFDHTTAQVAVGSTIGVICAIAWWRIVRFYQRRYVDFEGRRVFFDCLVHNHRMARFHVNGAGDISHDDAGLGSSPLGKSQALIQGV
eukprot:TRINITY_DN34603_c0_g1_i1.p1 TRINITY_DN34603_c0_g1~~TRINITY_DN34603_c0_g1_i1.p1  ORF type:complete len:389 (+),score=16.67 TRINITY_DN34603_c0_g1_i1:86-1252(+)